MKGTGPLDGIRVLDMSRVLETQLGLDETSVAELESRGVVATVKPRRA